MEDYMANLIIDNQASFNIDNLSLKLTKAFMGLLPQLLTKGSFISLERLQLCSLDIKLTNHSEESTSHNRTCIGDKSFINISGVKTINEKMSASIVVTYFERGAKKYHKPDFLSVDKNMLCEDFGKDIDGYLAMLDLKQALIYKKDTYELNGFSYAPLPIEVVILKMIELARRSFKNDIATYSFSFFKALDSEKEIFLSTAIKDLQGVFIIANDEPDQAVQLIVHGY